jgi:hypothetical protein
MARHDNEMLRSSLRETLSRRQVLRLLLIWGCGLAVTNMAGGCGGPGDTPSRSTSPPPPSPTPRPTSTPTTAPAPPDAAEILTTLREQGDAQVEQVLAESLALARSVGRNQQAIGLDSLKKEGVSTVLGLLGSLEAEAKSVKQHAEELVARLDKEYPGWRESAAGICVKCRSRTDAEAIISEFSSRSMAQADSEGTCDMIGFLICGLMAAFTIETGLVFAILIFLCLLDACIPR